MTKNFDQQYKTLMRGVAEITPADEFKERLGASIENNQPLRVKQGFDPTAPDIHLGHTVGIRKLKQFQDLGHQVVLIVGDYTALVGDPSGRSSARPPLGHEEILENAKTYQDQFFRILDKEKTEVHFNGSWFSKMPLKELISLTSKYTVARMLERDDFEKRYKGGSPIFVHEFLYPLMQAYDSVEIKADIEIGATEQKFNLLVGRSIQPDYGLRGQMILTMPILVGLDGKMKMSKSSGNYVAVDDPPGEMFGKLMSIPDELIVSYAELASDMPLARIAEIREQLQSGSVNPMAPKKELAALITDMYHGAGSGDAARTAFEQVFSHGQDPEDMEEFDMSRYTDQTIWIVQLLTDAGLSKSNGEARRLIAGGGVSLDGERIEDVDTKIKITRPAVLKVGKRRFRRLTTGTKD
ncbi:MAG: tyrosine--tRNA ligase [candidate division Zixibacteria bacterium]|nr:tyrosine--tRNA ligase [candidate division Zixibacteria bacterium]